MSVSYKPIDMNMLSNSLVRLKIIAPDMNIKKPQEINKSIPQIIGPVRCIFPRACTFNFENLYFVVRKPEKNVILRI